jgi:hypothetical protein
MAKKALIIWREIWNRFSGARIVLNPQRAAGPIDNETTFAVRS